MQIEEVTIERREIAEINEPRLCPECGTPSVGEYCPHCGEKMEMHLFSVKHYIKEVFHEFAVFDTKFFRTIPALLFKPGFLSKEYIAGRRKRYLTPARLYILVAFISFFALGYYLNQVITDLFQITRSSNGQVIFEVGTVKGEQARRIAETFIRFLIEISPYVLLLGSTPIFALILKLIYWKRHILYAEHLVFSFHFYAFSLIILIGSLFLHSNYSFFVSLALFLVYLYVALKRFYSDRGFLLAVRLLACTFAYFNIASLALFLTGFIAYTIGYQLGEIPEWSKIFQLARHP
jgi:hypothetical protein